MQLLEFELASRGAGCKDHPNDKQQPGVCSSCLRDKLSQLYNKNPAIDPPCCSPSPASPQHFSSAAAAADDDISSNHAVPGNRRRFRRNGSHAMDPAACMVSFNYGLNLKKSRSLAFASRSRQRERDASGGYARKKDGFWSKRCRPCSCTNFTCCIIHKQRKTSKETLESEKIQIQRKEILYFSCFSIEAKRRHPSLSQAQAQALTRSATATATHGLRGSRARVVRENRASACDSLQSFLCSPVAAVPLLAAVGSFVPLLAGRRRSVSARRRSLLWSCVPHCLCLPLPATRNPSSATPSSVVTHSATTTSHCPSSRVASSLPAPP